MKLVIASDIHGSATFARMLFEHIADERPDRIVLLGDLLYHGPRNDLPQGYAPREVYALLNEHAERIIAVRGNCDAEVDQMVLTFPCMDDAATLHDADRTLFLTHGHIYAPEDAPQTAAPAHDSGSPAGISEGNVLDGGSPDTAASRNVLDSRSSTIASATPSHGTSRKRAAQATPRPLASTKPFPALPPHAAFLSGHTHIKVLKRRGSIAFVNPGSVSLPKDGSRSFATYHDGTFELKALETGDTLSTLHL